MGHLRIEKLEVYDDKGPRSKDTFGNLTVIYGPSNTGKSLMIKCIDYTLGSKDRWPLDNEFKRIELTLSCDGHIYRLMRKNEDNKLYVYEDEEFKGAYGLKDLDGLFSEITGIELGVDIPSKINNERKSYTWREMITTFLWKERIIQKESVFKSKFNSHVYRMAGINYLYNGDLFKDMILNEEVEQWKDMHKSYQRRLRIIEDKIREVDGTKGDDTEKDMKSMLDRMKELLEGISDAEKSLEDVTGKLRSAREESIELRMDREKFKTVMDQYISKVRRAEMIVDGMMNQDRLKCPCPICNNTMEAPNMRKHYGSIMTEYRNNKAKMSDLENLIADTNTRIKSVEQEIARLEKDSGLLKSTAERMRSELNALGNKIKGNSERLVIIENMEELLKMKSTYDEKLKEKCPVFKKFTENRIEPKIKEGILKELRRTLGLCFGYKDIGLDADWNPVVDGRKKEKEGDGNAGIINTLMLMAISKVLSDKGAGPGLLIVDSPCTAFKDLRGSEEVVSRFLEITEDYSRDFQIILTDINNEMNGLLHERMQVHLIEFTKEDKERYGFLEGVRDRTQDRKVTMG